MKTSIKTHSKSTISLIAASLLSVAAIVSAPRAQAAEQGDILTKAVNYGDLNLNSKKGVVVLYARLRGAAREVCAPFEGPSLYYQMLWNKCYDHAITAAVSAINKPAITAFHNQSTRHGDKS
jgi:UrcA family protein